MRQSIERTSRHSSGNLSDEGLGLQDGKEHSEHVSFHFSPKTQQILRTQIVDRYQKQVVAVVHERQL